MKRSLFLILVLAVTTASCASATAGPLAYEVTVERNVQFTDTLDMDVFTPAGAENPDAVVLVHGGSWYGGQKENIEPFADLIATRGFTVFNVTYTVGGNGGGYPQSYEDLICAYSTASELSGNQPLTIVGHSAGAHLAATTALSADTFASDRCLTDTDYAVAGLVGLAGPYDASRYGPLLVAWFGTTIADDPDRWAAGGPYGYVEAAEQIPVVLVHGDLDQVVQLGFSYDFEETLTDLGYPVALTVLEDADHNSIIDPLLDADTVVNLIAELRTSN